MNYYIDKHSEAIERNNKEYNNEITGVEFRRKPGFHPTDDELMEDLREHRKQLQRHQLLSFKSGVVKFMVIDSFPNNPDHDTIYIYNPDNKANCNDKFVYRDGEWIKIDLD